MANTAKTNVKSSYENRRNTAIVFAIICFLLGTFVFGGGKLASARNNVTALLTSGDTSIVSDMKNYNDSALEIITVARRRLGEDDEAVKTALAAFDASKKAAAEASSAGDISSAKSELNEAILALENRLNEAGLADDKKDAGLVRGSRADMNSYSAVMDEGIRSYNSAVDSYNSEADGFPAGLISAVRRIGAPERFN